MSYNKEHETLKGVSLSLEAESYFYPYITGREYLALFPAGESGFNLEKWKQLFSLPLNDITESYSTGMRKKLALLHATIERRTMNLIKELI